MDVTLQIVVRVAALPGPDMGEAREDTFAPEALGRVFTTTLSDWKPSHLPPDARPLPSVAHDDQLLKRHGRTADEKDGS